MAEEEPRVQKVLAYLESIKEHGLVRPKTIGESAEIVGQDLREFKRAGSSGVTRGRAMENYA